ncbi:hypothetical protein [Bradyrhizobium sp.]|uniref:hypothetical protein n=1 Tax=Bradyrhizobium sp. TaxID=376 RepID=UPI003C4A4432
MSHLRTGIFGAIALSATLGAVQFAFGHDLTQEFTSGLRAFSAAPVVPAATLDQVNRAAKADRAGPLARAQVPTRTISIHLDRVADTSVVVRIPLADGRSGPHSGATSAPASLISTRPNAQRTVACEPVVSVLTEIAKRLQPGRCLT